MSLPRAAAAALVATFPGGARLWRLAPVIPLLAFLPEMIQHAAEIALGMFAGPEAFRAMANDPLRWNFGYAKIAGLFLAIFGAARYWSLAGTGNRWWDLRTVAWRPFLIGAAVNVGAAIALIFAQPALSPAAYEAVNIAVTVATLPIMVLMLGGLFGDATVTIARVYRTGWIQGIAMGLLFALAMVPAQWLHRFNHLTAMGAAPPAVWALMIWDALLVSLMAVWAGTGLAAGYALPAAARGEETFLK